MFTFLKVNSIDSWYTLENKFLGKFSTVGELPTTMGDLTNIKQKDDELILEYLERFKKIYDEIEGLSQDTVITCFKGGLKSHTLKTEFELRNPRTIGEMFKTAKHVALAIEQPDRRLTALKDVVDVNKGEKPKFDLRLDASKGVFDKGKSFTSRNRPNARTNFNAGVKNRNQKLEKLFRLNIPVENLVTILTEKYGVKDPPSLNPHTDGVRNRSRYRNFHQSYGHNAEYCYQLKKIIESLKRKGLLAEFLKDELQWEQQSLKGKEKVIDVILNKTHQ